ncbi:hypothetical protein DERP_000112 [Dermatophagoides pteronyssinus]|uniref:Uncharacterized protein n=1 Tax=Dermatophagoides pteronyssinus TaxID=6956 RepID=A0ABQ8IZ90_DERPT|nr:hypothetical protein DERP_000112 [Dermatophagoides pteronyssinus]
MSTESIGVYILDHAAVLPSLTASTVVSETPAKSPPQNTHSMLVDIVSTSTNGNPVFSFIFNGFSALITSGSVNDEPKADITN